MECFQIYSYEYGRKRDHRATSRGSGTCRPLDLSACNNVVKDVTENLDKFELGIALSKIYDFIWDEVL